MPDTDVCYLSATRLLALFRSRQLSPVELMQAIVQQDAAINGAINSFGDRYFESALTAARASETRWMQGDQRPLDGIPLAVKDSQRVAGQRTTFGSPVYKDNIERQSDPMIARLLDAGAIIHARSTASEFCVSGICRSPMWGDTLNPWNTQYSPGGSSGGSGAALAAGLTILATGTDMGGSIRVPASACGVVGYKPPHGRNPDGAPWNLDPFNHCGPLARTVADIGLVQNIVSGPHALDHDSLRQTIHLPEQPEGIRGFRIAYSIDLGYRQVDPDVRRNTLAALEVFRALGCTVTEVDLGWTEELDTEFLRWFPLLHVGRNIVRHAAEKPHLLSADMLKLAALIGAESKVGDVATVIDMTNRMYATFGPVLAAHDVFLCPTMTVPAVPNSQTMFGTGFEIDGKAVDPEFGYSTTHQFNMLRNCPVMSVPSGLAGNGVPTGLQIIGRTFDDLGVYRAAAAYEQARGPWYESASHRPRMAEAAPLKAGGEPRLDPQSRQAGR